MTNEQDQITQFMVKATQNTPEYPTIIAPHTANLRVTLILEELLEFAEAVGFTLKVDSFRPNGNPVNLKDAYDGIIDLLVVVIGAAVAMGLKLEPGWQEVHRSNMSKFIDGHRREDGKWIKGPSYSPAQLEPIIKAMLTSGGLTEPLVEEAS